jgi:hypothetical protein
MGDVEDNVKFLSTNYLYQMGQLMLLMSSM